MTPDDWLATVRNELATVVDDSSTFTRGVRETLNGQTVSVTITDNPRDYEAYIVVNAETTQQAKETVEQLKTTLAIDEHMDRAIGTDGTSGWANTTVDVSPQTIKHL